MKEFISEALKQTCSEVLTLNNKAFVGVLLWVRITILLVTPEAIAAADFSGNAFVQEDATLKVGGRIIRLFGIYIPTSEVRRAAARALDFEIRGFVHCYKQWINSDGSVTAVCWNDITSSGYDNEGKDLSAYLIEQGWALATPDAPFEYHALERIARYQARGLWAYYGYGY